MKTYPLKRYPGGKKLLAELKQGGEGWFEQRILPPGALITSMCNSEVGAELTAATGKHDGVIQGRYRRAQVFFFDASGEIIMAVTERGERGSNWCWLSKNEHPIRFGQQFDEPLLPFWPQFVLDLNAALGWDRPPGDILDARAFEKLSTQAALDQLGVLEAEVSPAPAAPKRRLR